LDRHGREIGRIFVENRSAMAFEDVPENFLNALKAGEDSRFDEHGGVDYLGIGRAAWKMLKNGEATQGASTLTQQLARDAYGLKAEAKRRKESGFQRKMVEIFLAQRIEQRYGKKEILAFFVNRSFLGSGFYGLRSAALGYYGKEPKDLTIPECASIVTILRNPLEISPLNHLEANRKGRNHVIWRMFMEKMITEQQMNAFQAEPVALNPRPLQRGTSHVYEMIAAESREMVGEDAFTKGGFVIHTTIDKDVQTSAEKTMHEVMTKVESDEGYTNPQYAKYKKSQGKPGYLQGAMVMMDHETGEILSYIGGRDYSHSQYDFIREGKKPLGTAFFPFVTAAALSGSQTPATMLEDEPMDNRMVMVGGSEGVLGEWGSEMQKPVFEGQVTMRHALEKSKIAATVRLGTQSGVDQVAEMAKRFGFTMPAGEKLPRLLLGMEPASMMETVAAYASFARGGSMGAKEGYVVEKIVDGDGALLSLRIKREPPRNQPAVDSAVAYQVHSMLRGVMKDGNVSQRLSMPDTYLGGVKTGTMHDFSNCWAVGYSPRVVCGVWCGFLQGAVPIAEGAFGGDLALPIWQAAMKALRPENMHGDFRKPAEIMEVDVCRISGQRAGPYCYEEGIDEASGLPKLKDARRKEFFRAGTEKIPICSVHGGGVVGETPEHSAGAEMAALDAVPVRAKAATLLGDDPYQSQVQTGEGEDTPVGEEGSFFRSAVSSVERMDLGDKDAEISLPKPGKLILEVEIE
jgi:membrane carboxypeptidase/penicillin-binding protein